jgi:hypothetical protein
VWEVRRHRLSSTYKTDKLTIGRAPS